MIPRGLVARLGLVVAVVGFAAASFAFARTGEVQAEPAPATVDDVVLFTIPMLGIDDVRPETMPVLSRLAADGAIAATNVRTLGSGPDILDGYATLSAGNRVGIGTRRVVEPSPDEGRGEVPVTTTTEVAEPEPEPGSERIVATAQALPAVITGGTESDPDQIVVPHMAEIIDRADAGNDPNAQPGALAVRLQRHGLASGVVTNAGSVSAPGEPVAAAAGVVAADRFGWIPWGSVGPELLRPDPFQPRGATADGSAFAAAVEEALDHAALVVVDPGETTRVASEVAARLEAAAANPPDSDGVEPPELDVEALRLDSLRRTDTILGLVEQRLGPNTLLMVVGLTPPDDRWALTPMVFHGAGTPAGYLHSSSTHRPDLVTLTDLAPTVLDALGVDPPAAMIGNPLAYRPGEASWSGALQLDELLERRAPIDRPMAVGFIVVQTVVYLAAIASLLYTRALPAWSHRIILGLVVTCASWPLATFWLRIAPSMYGHGAWTFVLCWVIAAVVAFGVTRIKGHVLDPVLALCALTIATLVGDLATGAHLQYGSFFGYAPTTAPRFTGIGNAAFALLGGATVATCAALVARTRDRSIGLWLAGTVGAIVIIADGAPWLGADVGGTLTLVPVLCVMMWSLSGRRVRWHTVGLAALAAALVLAFAVGFESLRDPGQRTHIGRFFLRSGDGVMVQDTLARKWSTNMEVLRRSPLAWLVPVIAGVGFVAVASGRAWRRVLPPRSPERTGVTATLAMGFVGWLLNDSGVVVLALAAVFLGPYILLLAQAANRDRPVEPSPAGPGRATSVKPSMSSSNESSLLPLGDQPKIVALVPAKDRADSVGATVTALRALTAVDRVLVIDDGSGDETAAVALAAGAEVLRLPRNRGKGAAVVAGAVAAPDADVFLLIDADLAETAAAADVLLAPVLAGDADLTVGVLPAAGGRAGFGTVKRLSAWGIHRASGAVTEAPLSGQRAIRAELLRELTACERFGLEVAMTIDVVRSGGRLVEVEVPMDHRHTGRTLAGFAHRARQGRDIAVALWPRITSRRVRRVGLAAGVVVLLVGSYFTATSQVPAGEPVGVGVARVVLFGIPGIEIGDVDAEVMPNLHRLSREGGFAMATPRTGGALSPSSAYGTIGAGDRVHVGHASGIALEPDAEIEGDPASVVVERRSGPPGPARVILPRMATTIADAGTNLNSLPGALGGALADAGLSTGVVANSATVADTGEARLSAPAALAVAKPSGTVDFGEVGATLLRPSPHAPFGLEVDPDRFLSQVDAVLAQAEVAVLDPGEMDRALAYRSLVTEDVFEAHRMAALERTDDLIGRLADRLPPSTLLVVTGVTPTDEGRLVPVVINGPGIGEGGLTSPSTRRPDLITITDLAPTVLSALKLPTPAGMIGQPVEFTRGTPDRASMQEQVDLIRHRDEIYPNLHRTFVHVTIVLYLIALVAVLRPLRQKGLHQALAFGALVTVAWPLAGYILRAFPASYGLGWVSFVMVWALAATLAAGASRFRQHPLDPLLVIGAATVAVLVADVATGAHLQVSSYLGHTPSVAARFVGMGNATFGVFAGATVVTCTALVARSSRPKDAWWLAAAVGVVAVVANGAPWLGADVGGILSLAPSVGILLMLLAGGSLTWRSIGAFAAATLVLLAVAVGFEGLRPPSNRTHIGRFFLGDGNGGDFWSTLARKWEVNVRLMTRSRWSWLVPGIGSFVVGVVSFGDGWRRLFARRSAEQAGLLALAAVALLGWASNDSGPVVAGLVFVYLGALVLNVTQQELRDEPVEVRTSQGSVALSEEAS